MQCIDFTDTEPSPIAADLKREDGIDRRDLIDDPLFSAREYTLAAGTELKLGAVTRAMIVGVASGHMTVEGGSETASLGPGEFCLLPACLRNVRCRSDQDQATRFLWAQTGDGHAA